MTESHFKNSNDTFPDEKVDYNFPSINQSTSKTIDKRLKKKRNKWTLIVTFSALVLIIISITIAYLVSKGLLKTSSTTDNSVGIACDKNEICSIQVVETIPPVLQYKKGSPKHDEISKHWDIMINNAVESIDILSFYWTMNSSDVKGGPYPQAKVGEKILNDLVTAAKRGVKVRIVQTVPTRGFPQLDTQWLATFPNIAVRSLNVRRLMKAGIIHTKAIVTDQKNAYVGSANFDWRALSEVKELGTVIYNCSCAGHDIQKIFDVNWLLAEEYSVIPSVWPKQYQTDFAKGSPMTIQVSDSVPARMYWSTSPPEFCAGKRTADIDAILDIIKKAKKFIYIAVMDYYAAIIYSYPKKYWSVLDTALREAMFNRGIQIYLLTSKWNSTRPMQETFLKSLKAFGEMPKMKGTLLVRQFTMPWADIPFSRVNHNKYMVTDNAAFVSTSNWSGDYFISTGGVALVINQTNAAKASGTVQEQLRQVFLRDWNSQYAKELKNVN